MNVRTDPKNADPKNARMIVLYWSECMNVRTDPKNAQSIRFPAANPSWFH